MCISTSEVAYTYGVIRDIDMDIEEEMLNMFRSDRNYVIKKTK